MAGRNIYATISLKANDFFTTVKKVDTSVKGLKTSFSDAAGSVKKSENAFSGAAKKIGAVAAAIGGISAIKGFSSSIVEAGTAYEDSLAKVSTIADTGIKSLSALSRETIDLSNTTGVAASDLNEALYQAISAGADTAYATDLVGVAVKAAKGGFTDTATAVDGLTSVLNTYGMATADAQGLANKFLITQNKGKTTFGDLASTIGQVAPVANSTGVSIDELLSGVASLTANGLSTSSAMTGMKAALSNIIKPTADAQKTAKALGIDFSTAALKSQGLSGFMKTLAEKTGGNTDAMAKLFGSVEGLNAMLTLTSDGGMSIMTDTMAEMKTNTTALDEAYNSMVDTVSGQTDILRTKLENMKINIFERLDSSKFVDVIKMASSALDKVMPTIENVSVAIGDGLYNAIVSASNFLGGVYDACAPALSNLADAFGGLWDSVSGMFSNISSEIGNGGVAEGIGGIVSSIADTAARVIDSISPVFDFIGEHWDVIQPILGAMLKGFLAFQGLKLGGGLITGFSDLIGKVGNAGGMFSEFGQGVSGVFDLFKSSGGGIVNFGSMVGMIGKQSVALGGSLGGLGGAFGKVGGAVKAVGGAFSFLTSPIGLTVLAIGAAVTAGVLLYKNWDKITETAKTVWNAVKKAFAPIAEFLSPIFEKIIDVAGNAWDSITTSVKPLKDAVVGAFKSAWELIKTVWDVCQPFFSAIWNGIKSAVSVIAPIIGTVFKTAWTIVKGVWDVATQYFGLVWDGIKAVFSVVSTFIGGAFNTAWTSIKFVWDTVGGYFTAIWNTISGIFSVVKDVFTGNWSGAWEGIKGIVDTWSGYFSGVWEGIQSVFSSVTDWFWNTFNAAWEAVKSIFSAVGEFFSGVWDTITKTFTDIGVSIGDAVSGAFKSVVNGVISFASDTINGFIRSVNWAIDVINKIPGVSITKLTEISLPRLAAGGIATRSTVVQIGEAGAEAVLPLSEFWNRLSVMLQPQPAPAATGNTYNITVNVDGRGDGDDTIAEKVARKIVDLVDNM